MRAANRWQREQPERTTRGGKVLNHMTIAKRLLILAGGLLALLAVVGLIGVRGITGTSEGLRSVY